MSDSSSGVQQKQSSFIKYQRTTTATTTPTKTTTTESTPALNIPGCKTSVQNSQLLTSIGIPSIDYFIGGGLPVGSVCVIGEDTFNYYSDIICRCFIAEGVLNKHEIFVADPFLESHNLLQRIPNVSVKDSNEEKENDKSDTKLRIAWRYGEQDNKTAQNVQQQQHNYFYLNKHMSTTELNECQINKFKFNTENDENLYKNLADNLKNVIDQRFNVTKLKQYKNIIRIETTKSRLSQTQYEGLFRIVKLARLNTLNSYLPETLDLAFHIKRKRLIVEILALPPDISEDSDEKKGRTTTAAMACASSGTGASSKLDF